MSDVTWRAARLTDAAGVAELFRSINRAAPIGLETEFTEVESRLSTASLQLDRDTIVGVDPTGRVLAYAEAADMGVGQGRFRIRLTNALHPELNDEVARTTHGWLIERTRQLHQQRRPDLPGVLGTRCAATDHARRDRLTEAGFEPVGRHQDLVHSLDKPIPVPTAADGITVVRYRSRYDEAARVAHNDAYADSPAALLPDAHAWPRHAVGLPNFLPDASFLALADTADGEEVVAFLFSLEHHDSTGQAEGAVHCLGTRAAWRRRGLATTLIVRALTSYQQAGLPRARLQVDSGNVDAVSLYTRLGFVGSGRGYLILQAPIA